MTWEIIHLHDKEYKVLNPKNWEELAYGIEHNVLVMNSNTEVCNEDKKEGEELLSLLNDLFD